MSVFAAHIFGMHICFDYKKRRKQRQSNSIFLELSPKEMVVLLCTILVAIIAALGFTAYSDGKRMARDKIDYKVVVGTSLESNVGGFDSYAVVFENEDIYILEPITSDGSIDYNIQIVIDNKNVISKYIGNIRLAHK